MILRARPTAGLLPLLTVLSITACSEAQLPPEASTQWAGTMTATTARWAPILTADAEWREVATDRRLASAKPLLRYRAPARPTLFAFWATYCPPCFAELPVLKDTHRIGRVSVVSVSLDVEQTKLAAAALGHHGVEHRSVVLTKASLPTVGDRLPAGLPFALLLDRKGQVVAHHSGELTAGKMTALLATGVNSRQE